MGKFRKKPVIVEAMQLRWDTWNEMCDFADVKPESKGGPYGRQMGEELILVIPTLEGTMEAFQNDWVIRGIKGELYPCKPDIFEETYEAVEELVEV